MLESIDLLGCGHDLQGGVQLLGDLPLVNQTGQVLHQNTTLGDPCLVQSPTGHLVIKDRLPQILHVQLLLALVDLKEPGDWRIMTVPGKAGDSAGQVPGSRAQDHQLDILSDILLNWSDENFSRGNVLSYRLTFE